MNEVIRKHRDLIMISMDIIFIVFSYLLAYFIRNDFGALYHIETFGPVMKWLPAVIILNLISSRIFKVNKILWQYMSVDEVISLTISIILPNLFWFFMLFILKLYSYPKTVPVIATMLLIMAELGVRLLYRLIKRKNIQSKRRYKAIIIGAGRAGSIILRDLTLTDRYDCRVIGFIDDDQKKKGQKISGVEVLGTTDDLPEIVRFTKADIAYLAIKNITQAERKKIIDKCKAINLKTKIITFDSIDGDKLTPKIRDVSIDDLLGRGEINLDNDKIKSYVSGKTVMVTGGGGSIGSEICRQILRYEPKQLVIVDIYENNMYDLQQEINIKKKHNEISNDIEIICLIGSVREKARINEIIHKYKPFILFHAAAHKHVPLVEDSPAEAIKNNVFGTYNVVKCCIENKVDTFVLISTDKAVNTTNVMGATKRMCELIVQGFRNNGITKLCAVRFGNVLGSNGSVIPLFKKQIESGGPVTVTDPKIIRYFMTIPEAAQLVIQAGTYAHEGEIFVLDMGEPVKILDLAENLIRLSGFVPNEDIKIEFTGLRPGEKMYEELILDKEKHAKTANDLIYVSEPLDIDEKMVEEKLSKLNNLLDKNKEEIKDGILNIIK